MRIELQAFLPGRSWWLVLSLGALAATTASAQLPDPITDPDSIARAGASVHPSVRASAARVEAARASIRPAGSLPDPMLMIGLENQALRGSGEPMNEMAMKTIGIGQMVPFPGKLALERRVVEAEAAVAERELEATRVEVSAEIRRAYYDLAFLERALEVVARNDVLLADLIRVSEASYGVGRGSQADVLNARVEAARLAEEATLLAEERRMALARLNGVLQRDSESPIAGASVPSALVNRIVPADPRETRFTSAALGARAASSPLPPLQELQREAESNNPEVRTHQAMIEAQRARVEAARRAHLPDIDVSVEYGQRTGMSDLVSATVSIPLPLRRASRQDQEVKAAEAELAALEAEHQARISEVRAEVAEAYAGLEQQRTLLALYLRSTIPQARAALESGTASFQVGRVDFMTILESQATLYEYEIAYHRALTTFASRLAELERLVGKEIL